MLRTTLCAALLATAAASVSGQEIENDDLAVYAGQWVQHKSPAQNGLLMFLTVERGQKGEYFSISCTRAGGVEDRKVSIGYPKPLPETTMPLTLSVDGQPVPATATFTASKRDDAYTKSDIHGYELTFQDEAAFLRALQSGGTLQIPGQTMPVSLAGFTAALKGQSAYCR